MGAAETAFVVLLTFSAGHQYTIEKRVGCSDWSCVEHFVEWSRDSTTLTRLRAFDAPICKDELSGQVCKPPILDLRRG